MSTRATTDALAELDRLAGLELEVPARVDEFERAARASSEELAAPQVDGRSSPGY